MLIFYRVLTIFSVIFPQCAIKNSVKIWRLQIFSVSLHKISGTRQFESKLSLHSLAKSLHKI